MSANTFDLVVIGSGPAGQRGAIAAAKAGKRAAIIDKGDSVGGMCIHSGTIPSKTLRESILYLTGFRQRSFYGQDYKVKDQITVPDLRLRVRTVMEREVGVVRDQLLRNNVTILPGLARFLDAHTVEIEGAEATSQVIAKNVLIACGTRPARNEAIPFDGKRILDSGELRQVEEVPKELIVVGGGVIGLEYASMLTALRSRVTVIDQRPTILDFVDAEIVEALSYHMRRQGAIFRLGEKVVGVEIDARGKVQANLQSGKRIYGDALLYAVGRQPNTDRLRLEAAGVKMDERGRLSVNENFQTNVPHIYAAGDVIGFPSLASASMEQGRLASCHMFGVASKMVRDLLPYGIYTIPEISIVGKTEKELTDAKVPYEVGVAKYVDLAKGQMVGDDSGMLKLLFHPDSLKLLGVHAIGESATEIIHVGQAVLALDGTVEYFRDIVFNYPTFAEAYKVAALNGLNKLA